MPHVVMMVLNNSVSWWNMSRYFLVKTDNVTCVTQEAKTDVNGTQYRML